MNIKDTINFKTLRDKGFNTLEIKDDEIIQVMTKTGMKCVVTQEHLFKLLADVESLKSKLGEHVPTTPYSEEKLLADFNLKKSRNLDLYGSAKSLVGCSTNVPKNSMTNSLECMKMIKDFNDNNDYKKELENLKNEFDKKFKDLENKINQGGK